MPNMVDIAKVDNDRQIVFGWAYVAVEKNGDRVVDHSGEFMDVSTLEDAAYLFNLHFRKSGEMHEGDDIVGELIESVVFTPEKLEKLGLAHDALPLGWWVGFYIDDENIFGKIKSGQYQAFSIQGRGMKTDVEE